MTEWLKVADCKSVGLSYIGSNPIFSIIFFWIVPQFDKITYFNQIFWLLVFFLAFYFNLLKHVLPLLAFSLKTRKKVSLVSASSSHLGLGGGDNAYVSYGDALSLSQNSNKFVGSQTKIQSQKASFVSTSAKLNLDADENKVEASFQY